MSPPRRACVAKKPKPKRGMRKKASVGAEEDAERDQRGAGEEAAADDAARVEDALDLDALGLRVVGVLEEVVLLHLAAEVEQRQRPGGEHDVGEEAAGVGELGVERGAGDQHEEARRRRPAGSRATTWRFHSLLTSRKQRKRTPAASSSPRIASSSVQAKTASVSDVPRRASRQRARSSGMRAGSKKYDSRAPRRA